MGRKLVELWDPALQIPELSEAEVVSGVRTSNRERMLVVLAVSEFKRRLIRASDAERAHDKRVARAAAGQLGSIIMLCDQHERAWARMWEEFREEARTNLGCRQAAAVLNWVDWLPTVAAALEREAVHGAGWVLAYNTQSVAVRALVRQLDTCRERLIHLQSELS